MPLGVFVPARAEDLSLSFAAGVDSAAQGAILYRNNASRYAALGPGTSGQVLTSGGAAANPTWQTPTTGVTDHGALTGLGDDDHTQYIITAPAADARNVIQSSVSTVTPITIRGAASQSDPLMLWQDSALATVAEMSAAGRLGLGAAPSATARLLVTITTASNMGVVIKSAASQSGNVLEAQDSAGATTGFFRVLAGGVASGPGAGSSSERFGSGSLAAGNLSVAVGSVASAGGSDSVAVGYASSASNTNCIAIGRQATSSQSGSLAIGTAANSSGAGGLAFGTSAAASGSQSLAMGNATVASAGASIAIGQGAQSSNSSTIAIGNGANASGSIGIAIGPTAVVAHSASIGIGNTATTTAANQMVIGGSATPINDTYIGKGVTNATPTATALNATGGSGTNITGANLVLAGGKGTGTGLGGSIKLQSTTAGSSGTTLATLQDRWVMTNTGVWQAWQPTTVQDRQAYDNTVTWATATDASRKARAVFSIWDTAAREGMRLEADGSNPMIGFLGANAVVRQTSGANLTNNVTAGGTDDTIANFTDLTTYANDAATIRNDIYQLARKLKQVNDALRLYGLLT